MKPAWVIVPDADWRAHAKREGHNIHYYRGLLSDRFVARGWADLRDPDRPVLHVIESSWTAAERALPLVRAGRLIPWRLWIRANVVLHEWLHCYATYDNPTPHQLRHFTHPSGGWARVRHAVFETRCGLNAFSGLLRLRRRQALPTYSPEMDAFWRSIEAEAAWREFEAVSSHPGDAP